MAPATVREIPAARKPGKSFYCTLYDENGIITKLPDGVLYFFNPDAGSLTEYTPEMAPWTCILGEAAIADTQQIMDRMHGGCAWIATHRANLEVA